MQFDLNEAVKREKLSKEKVLEIMKNFD